MNCSQLISILSSNNEHILYLASVLKPQKITFLIPTELGYIKYLEGVREVLIQILPGYVQEIEVYGDLTDSVNNYLYKLIGRQGVYLDLTNGPKKDLFLFQVQALANGIPTIFADIPRHRIYTVDSQGMLNFEEVEIELSIKNLVSSTGGEITQMSTMLYRKQEVEEILAYLCSNYGGWKQVIKVFKDKKRINLENNGLDLYFTLEGLNPVAVSEFTNFLHFLEQKSYLRHLTSGSGWARLSFKSSSLKRFLMTTGSWLEALTYLTVENIKGINEAQSGVVFLWDKESEFVRNELDVIATLDSNLICISCKDTEDLETSMLNELEVYAQRIGGENTIKLLVTSSPCQNVTLLERADEMGIDIVYFNGNLELFEKLMADRIISSS